MKRGDLLKAFSHRPSKRHLSYVTNLIRQICDVAGQRDLIEATRASFQQIGLSDAIQRHDNNALFDWLAEAISYQGIADSVAAGYIEQHGTVSAADVEWGLASSSCLKLQSFWHFEGCGYRKGANSCNQPKSFRSCYLPKHDLRNGQLNQAVYSLHLFFRDVADNDLVTWIDRRLQACDVPLSANRAQRLGEAILVPLKNIHGVSDKVLSMTMASLLLAGDPGRVRWVAAGAGMIAVDSLVHNWLHRTGILRAMRSTHVYGLQCYGPSGCAEIINLAANAIDCREYNAGFPARFPRFIQKAIWSFCAANGLDQCNGNQIDDTARCQDTCCPIYANCARVVLNLK